MLSNPHSNALMKEHILQGQKKGDRRRGAEEVFET